MYLKIKILSGKKNKWISVKSLSVYSISFTSKMSVY